MHEEDKDDDKSDDNRNVSSDTINKIDEDNINNWTADRDTMFMILMQQLHNYNMIHMMSIHVQNLYLHLVKVKCN